MSTAIYTRQSIEKKDSVSIDTQIEQCKAFASNDIIIYKDAGYSGKDTNRPDFERMMDDIKNGLIDTVISYRLDRVSRNIMDFANLLTFFDKHSVKYISATEQFDTSTPMGRAMIYIVMVFAQLERETIASRIEDNYRYRSKQGLFMGGNAPFGYSSERFIFDGKKASMLIPNKDAKTLNYIFDEFISKQNLSYIAKQLNMSGIPTATGKTWTFNAVKRVIQNISPVVADVKIYDYLNQQGYNISNPKEEFDSSHGMCVFFKNKNRNETTEIESQLAVIGLHQPLISSEKYIKAQSILKTISFSSTKRSSKSSLAGLVKCAECGYSFGLKSTSKNGNNYSYYHCRSRTFRAICDNTLYIKSDELEDTIVKSCINHIDHIISKKLVRDKKKEIQYDPTEDLKTEIENLISNIGKGNAIVDKLLTDKITTLQMQIDELKSKERSKPVQISQTDMAELKAKFKSYSKLSIEEQTGLIRSLVKQIEITKDSEITIAYLF